LVFQLVLQLARARPEEGARRFNNNRNAACFVRKGFLAFASARALAFGCPSWAAAGQITRPPPSRAPSVNGIISHTRQAPHISLLQLPSYSPELNPVENIWQFLRQNHLGNRVFKSYTDIVDPCCTAWNALAAEPKRIASTM
jgi:hypothetical protein